MRFNLGSVLTRKQTLQVLLWVLLTLGAIGILVYNRGVKYAYYQETYVVQLPQDVKAEVYNRFAGSPNVSKIDRGLFQIDFQGASAAETSQVLSDLQTELGKDKVTGYTKQVAIPANLRTRIIYLTLSLLIVSILALNLLKPKTIFRLPNGVWRWWILNVLSLGSVVLIELGVLSALSLIYQLTELSFWTVVISILIVIIVNFVLWIEVCQAEDLHSLILSQRANLRYYAKFILGLWTITVVLLAIGLGTSFVLDGVLLIVSLVTALWFGTELPWWLYRLTLVANSRRQRFVSQRKQPEPEIVNNIALPSPKSKKKQKRKRK